MSERERDAREFMPRDPEPEETELRDVHPRDAELRDVHPRTAEPREPVDRSVEDEANAVLFPQEELNDLRSKWKGIQGAFVDEPRHSVAEADGLVAATIQRLEESFADARARLEGQWQRGGDVSTEELRMALRRYRSFFDRLLAV